MFYFTNLVKKLVVIYEVPDPINLESLSSNNELIFKVQKKKELYRIFAFVKNKKIKVP